MREHVVMTYYGDAKRITWRDGRQTQSGATSLGTVTLIPSGHEARWDVDGPIEVSHLYLSQNRLCEAAEALGAKTRLELVDRVAVVDPVLSRLLEVLALEAGVPDCAGRLMIERTIDLVSLQMLRAHSATAVCPGLARGGLAAWQARRVTDYLREHLADVVTLDELAALVGLSRFHFCTAFRQTLGMPPHRWLNALRMAEAKKLLANPRLAIVEIAQRVGFQTQSAFGVAFNKAEGLSPSAYRRAL